jgi:AcrR family transcriptional regulator
MGLREAKKQKIRASIIENAVALFRESGFEATTVRKVAERCELSEATFFNYFPTKDAVLSAWAHGVVDAAFDAAARDEARGVRPALRSLCAGLAREVESDRTFAARAWVRARMPSGPPEPAIRMLEASQAEGTLRRDLSARQMGDILYASICATIGSWLGRQAPEGSLAPELRRAADLVLDGARRRNERVRPTSAAATAPGPGLSTR